MFLKIISVAHSKRRFMSCRRRVASQDTILSWQQICWFVVLPFCDWKKKKGFFVLWNSNSHYRHQVRKQWELSWTFAVMLFEVQGFFITPSFLLWEEILKQRNQNFYSQHVSGSAKSKNYWFIKGFKKIVCKWKYFPNFLLCNFSEVLNIVAKFKMLHIASTAGKSRSCSLKSPFLSLAKYENLIWEICSLSQSIINSPVLKVIFHSLVSSALVLPPINELVNDKNQAVSWCRISETMQIDTLWIPCPEFMIGSGNWMYLL